MRYIYYAVAYQQDPDDFLYLTIFALVEYISEYSSYDRTCSLPSGKEVFLDTKHHNFKRLTLAEYETHIAFNTMEEKNSDTFAIFIEDFKIPDGS